MKCIQRNLHFAKNRSTISASTRHSLSSVADAKKIVDLRSDTLTKPTPAMRNASFKCDVGDDVFGEDTTVIELETKVAKMFNKEAALFFPSGTQSNLAGVMAWCDRRDSEVLLGDNCHIFLYEQGGIAQLAGLTPRLIKNEDDGTMKLESIERSIRTSNIHFPVTSLISIENTQNLCGGRVLTMDYLNDLRTIGNKFNIPIHCDGARIWNAAVALNKSVAEVCKPMDSISVCLSKGLGAPIGSALVGPKDYIAKARRIRKVLGGGMRQVGVIAAPAITALEDFEHGILDADHRRAKFLAYSINDTPYFKVDLNQVETNIVIVHIDDSVANLAARGPMPITPASTGFVPYGSVSTIVSGMLRDRGVLALPFTSNVIRLVTHRDLDEEGIQRAMLAFKDIANYLQKC